ncbi:hypothetical protein N7478_011762 [Penicillium angulare]|uniref:uncharacterized protein n=1 Tax=Penicillium angulare TaxID=116970 RepID=UPI0025406F6E|nr:uncharacterized protein N7478_011762 [Penicillium angulare]KAJ5261167.1 hypothetical protein N7478_011762 [Penicillium angulare]
MSKLQEVLVSLREQKDPKILIQLSELGILPDFQDLDRVSGDYTGALITAAPLLLAPSFTAFGAQLAGAFEVPIGVCRV